MQPRPDQSDERTRPADAVERLYVLWIASTLLLLFVMVVLAFFVSGRLTTYATAISSLDARLTAVESALHDDARRTPASEGRPASPLPRPSTPRTQPTSSRTASPAATTREGGRPTPTSVFAALDEEALTDRLAALLKPGKTLPFELADASAAAALLREVRAAEASSNWSAPLWTRLAIVAALVGQTETAAQYAERASTLGDTTADYLDVAARLALDAGRGQEAAVLSTHLTEVTRGSPTAHLLMAESSLALGQPEQAEERLADAGDCARLSERDRLRAGRLLAALERWSEVDRCLDGLEELPDALALERDYLRARLMLQNGQLPQALAILDYLLDQRPDDAELQIWRGVVLLRANQVEAARAALDAAAQQAPARPEPWYWRAILEINSGQPADAREFLQKALAASARYGPAWEALGTLALNQGDLAGALEALGRAVRAEPRRAAAHFLLAVAQAKASRREASAQALREALRLDRTYLETAQKTDVLRKLFDTGELEALLPATSLQPTTAESQPTEPG